MVPFKQTTPSITYIHHIRGKGKYFQLSLSLLGLSVRNAAFLKFPTRLARLALSISTFYNSVRHFLNNAWIELKLIFNFLLIFTLLFFKIIFLYFLHLSSYQLCVLLGLRRQTNPIFALCKQTTYIIHHFMKRRLHLLKSPQKASAFFKYKLFLLAL